MTRSRIVPREPFGRPDARRLASAHGLLLAGQVEPTETEPFEEVWQTPDGGTTVRYVEDFILNLTYLVVDGERADEHVDALRFDLFDPYEPTHVLSLADEAGGREERLRAAALLGAVAPDEPNEDFVNRFQRALTDADGDVRLLAVFAAGYPGWRELISPLRANAAGDEDPRVREAAAHMVRNLQERTA
jgi:hypothetical protein